MIWLVAAALAGSAVVTVEVGPDGPRVLRVVPNAGRAPARVGTPGALGSLEVLGETGDPLASLPLEDPRIRSIALPEGGGETGRLTRAIGRYEIDWPPGAARVRLGARESAPGAPPTRDGVIAVQSAGLPAERLDLLFLGDGYSESQLDRFADDVDAVVAHLQTLEPYGAYSSLLNIWRVDTASAESGISHAEDGVIRDTAFGCYYGCAGIERLVCCDDAAVLDAAAAVGPVEGVVVLVNDPEYGGSGGFTYATAYNGDDGLQVAAHELGHSLVLLRDEYDYYVTDDSVFTGPNCAKTDDGSTWPEWLGVDGVDAYRVCSYDNFWRPTENNCMMRTLRDNYCPVCREAAVLALYDRIPDLLSGADPPPGDVDATGDADPVITIETLVPPEQLVFEWTLDGEIVADLTGPDVRPRCHPELAGELSVRVYDPTPWVRADPRDLLQSTAGPWTVAAEACAEPAAESEPCGCRSSPPMSGWLALLPFLRRRRAA
jgi:hypothetical protein